VPVSVYDLASEVFAYLIALKRRLANAEAVSADAVRVGLSELLLDLDARAASGPQPAAWQAARQALVYLADEQLAHRRDWPGRADWAAQRLEQTLLKQPGNDGPRRFYELCEQALADTASSQTAEQIDLRTVLYVALQLGFEGRLADDPAARRELTARLFSSLPAAARTRERAFFPETIEHTTELDPDYRPSTRLAYVGMGALLVLAVYLATTWGYWNDMVGDLRQDAAAVAASTASGS
jgi:type IV/VI secretion system ImpK/VasF family protein